MLKRLKENKVKIMMLKKKKKKKKKKRKNKMKNKNVMPVIIKKDMIHKSMKQIIHILHIKMSNKPEKNIFLWN